LNRTTLNRLVAVVALATLSLPALTPAVRAQDQNEPRPAPTAGAGDAVPANAQQNAATPAAGAARADAAKDPLKVDPNKVVLTVGNEKITAGDVEALLSDLSPDQRRILRTAGRRQVADQIIKIKLLSQEAQKRGLQNSPKVKRQLELVRDQILASTVLTDVQQKHYEQNKDRFAKIRARHILIRFAGSRVPVRPGQKELSDQEARAKAEDLKKKIAGGADFAELARKESDDIVSGADGGDLGDPFGHGKMVPEFDKVAFELKPGQISDPVKTQFGYHLIQVQEVFGFDDVQRDVAAQSDKQVQELLEGLKKDTKVEVDESYFGPPQAQPGQGGPRSPGGAAAVPGARQAQPQQQPGAGQNQK
jgi:peptidyl-prolyl cis-trans isomerase C